MNKAVFTIVMFFAVLLNMTMLGQKAVDLSTTDIWPAIKGAIPDNTFEDVTYKYYGGYRYIPKHLFDGFSAIGLPVNHPGGGAISFDWELSLTKDPNGVSATVFNHTEPFTLSNSDILNFATPIDYVGMGEHRLTASLSSADDVNSSNNTASFDFELTDSKYGFANSENINSSFTLLDYPMGANGDAVGIELYFPQPAAGVPHVINSYSVVVSDDYTGVIGNGNATLVAVIWGKDSGTGEWDFTAPLWQSDPKTLALSDVNTVLTTPMNDVSITSEGEYLLAVHIFNNNDATDGGRIAIASDPDGQGPKDLRCVMVFNGFVEYADFTPAIWANVEPSALPVNTDANILSFSLPSQVNSDIDAGTQVISVTLPQGTDLSSLIATYTLSDGATAKVGGVAQVSGTTPNNFASPITYVVTAEDGTTTKSWTVNVDTEASSATEITAFTLPSQVSSTINAGTQVISVTMPQGTDLSNLVATYTLSDGATAKVGGVAQVSGTTPNNFESSVTYVVTAEDGTTTKSWTVNVDTEASSATEITAFTLPSQVSSTINAGTQVISVTMPQGTDLSNLVATYTLSDGATAKVGGVAQVSGTTSNNFESPITYLVTAEDGTTTKSWTVNVATETSNAAEITAFTLPSQVSSTINAGTQVISVTMPQGTDLSSLIATYTLSDGAAVMVGGVAQISGTTANNFASPIIYEVTAEDGTTTKSWTVNVATETSNAAEITAFTLPSQVSSTINAGTQVISVTMPQGTDLSSLIATYTLSDGAAVMVGGVAQVSGTTSNNFESPITYLVTAEDGTTTKSWTVNVATETSSEAAVISFQIPGQVQASVINSTLHNISVLLPQGADLTNLVATFELSEGAIAKINGIVQESGVTSNDYTNPVTYIVTASDGISTQPWTVLVSRMTTSTTKIVSFNIPNQASSTIFSGTDITVYMPQSTDVSNLVPNFVLATGATVSVGGVAQESGVTTQDFTDPVVYTVTAFDGVTTEDWTVTIDIYTPSEGDFVDYEIIDQYNSIINPGNKTIAVQVFDNADITSLIAEFSLPPGAQAYVGGTLQESGVTTNNFTNPVQYQVNGASGNIYIWTVTVTQLSATDNDLLSFDIPNQINSFINSFDKTVSIMMPSGTDITGLIPNITMSIGAVATVDGVEQISGVTENDYTNDVLYTITAADGVTSDDYVVSVLVQSSEAEILAYSIPDQVSSDIDVDNKSINVIMPSGTDVSSLVAEFQLSVGAVATVATIDQESGVTANNFTNSVVYSVAASDGVTFQEWTVNVDVEAGDAEILAYSIPDQVSSDINADSKGINVIMPFGTDVSLLTADFQLSEGAVATIGSVEQESGVSSNDFTNSIVYMVTASDGITVQEWTVSVVVEAGETEILAYSIPGQLSPAIISSSSKTVDVAMPPGTNLSALVATFQLSDGAVATVGSIGQESGVTANDFANTVVYAVTASDGVTVSNWNVSVTAEQAEADILTYSIPGQLNVSINDTDKTIEILVPIGANVSAVKAEFTLSNGAVASVGGIIQESGVSENDFTSPVVYEVTSVDGNTVNQWTVIVEQQQISAADFLSYSINGVSGEIDYLNAFIRIVLPAGTSLSSLVANYTTQSGTVVSIAGVVQNSGVTINNFSNIVKYKLLPASGSPRNWHVSVSIEGEASNGTDILYYGFYGQTNPAEINAATHTITVNLEPSLDVTQLIPMFYLSNRAVAYVDGLIQWSGQNVLNFSEPLAYTIVAEDGLTSQVWDVIVTTNQNASTDITSFRFSEVPNSQQYTTIYKNSGIVYVDVPSGTDRSSLTAEYQLSSGATATVNNVEQQTGETVNDFSLPVTYSVLAQNGTTSRNWTVSVRHYVGVYQLEKQGIKLYPNPAGAYVNIEVSESGINGTAMFIDMTGRVVRTFAMDNLLNQLTLQDFKPGVYVIVLQNNQQVWTERLLIK